MNLKPAFLTEQTNTTEGFVEFCHRVIAGLKRTQKVCHEFWLSQPWASVCAT